MSGLTTSVDLTDAELLSLDGECSEKVQREVERAKRRASLARSFSDLTERQRAFVEAVVTEASEAGLLVLRRIQLRHCHTCGRNDGYVKYKRGPNRGCDNWDKPRLFSGVDLAYRSVIVRNHATIGCCAECFEASKAAIVSELHGVRAEVPDALRHPEAPRFKRWRNRHCTVCGWKGHEGEMGRSRSLFGSGTWPSTCPQCNHQDPPLGSGQIRDADGHEVVEVSP